MSNIRAARDAANNLRQRVRREARRSRLAVKRGTLSASYLDA